MILDAAKDALAAASSDIALLGGAVLMVKIIIFKLKTMQKVALAKEKEEAQFKKGYERARNGRAVSDPESPYSKGYSQGLKAREKDEQWESYSAERKADMEWEGYAARDYFDKTLSERDLINGYSDKSYNEWDKDDVSDKWGY